MQPWVLIMGLVWVLLVLICRVYTQSCGGNTLLWPHESAHQAVVHYTPQLLLPLDCTLSRCSQRRNENSPRLSSSPLPVWLCFCSFVCFLFFPSCLCSCCNLLCSTTPWQHIRGGFPLSGVWSVSNSFTLSLFWQRRLVLDSSRLKPLHLFRLWW